jgi:hypothetical protein
MLAKGAVTAESRGNGATTEDNRKALVERIAASAHFSRTARLRGLLVYLCDRVLDGDADQIHEQEVGQKVFGRPPDYDTATDNIVRVHASMLRKRLEQYFSEEGADEPLLVEIPRGNYAPIFRHRAESEPVQPAETRTDWRIWALGSLAVVFACSTAYFLFTGKRSDAGAAAASRPAVRLFWSQVFRPNQATDIVLDDAAVGMYQDMAGKPLALKDYFDRGYLRGLPETAATAEISQQAASSIVLRRYSSYANASFLWKLFQIAGSEQPRTSLHFARDYSFRELKANNVVLLGNSHSNPWVEPFEDRLGLRWVYDKPLSVYYPVDTRANSAVKSFRPADSGETREGFFMVSLLPNLGGNGNVLIVSGTGGHAMGAAADFLGDEQGVSQLLAALHGTKSHPFPYFEALLRVTGRSTMTRDTAIVLCRPPRL